VLLCDSDRNNDLAVDEKAAGTPPSLNASAIVDYGLVTASVVEALRRRAAASKERKAKSRVG
jgi:hypothetical protein